MFIKILSALVDQSKSLRDRGAVAGEYAVLLALIAVVIVAAIGPFTAAVGGAFNAATGVIN
ncbi:MAG: Flp family type IVb pilin [Acidimicrobiales bacterium]